MTERDREDDQWLEKSGKKDTVETAMSERERDRLTDRKHFIKDSQRESEGGMQKTASPFDLLNSTLLQILEVF